MRPAIFGSVPNHPISNLGGVPTAAAGIEFLSVLGAPGDELVRIEVGSDHDLPSAATAALELLGLALPLVERDGENLAVHHDFEDALVVVAAIPGDADCGDRLATIEHLQALSRCVAGIVPPSEVERKA